MELPHIGLACMVCNRNDYLPFKCTSCNKIVCIDHRANHGDECVLNQTNFKAAPEEGSLIGSLKQACDFCRKITLKLELSKCAHCPGQHCLYHRHQVQHNCAQLLVDKEARSCANEARELRQQEALAKLRASLKQPETKANEPSGQEAAPTEPKNKALARRVRLMKMKQSATCPKGLMHDTSIRTDQDKLFLEVKFVHEPRSRISSASQDGKSANIWTSPKWTVGQTIDYPAHLLGVINKNHIEGSDQLVLRKPLASDAGAFIDLDSKRPFQTYVEAGELDSGDLLFLTHSVDSTNGKC